MLKSFLFLFVIFYSFSGQASLPETTNRQTGAKRRLYQSNPEISKSNNAATTCTDLVVYTEKKSSSCTDLVVYKANTNNWQAPTLKKQAINYCMYQMTPELQSKIESTLVRSSHFNHQEKKTRAFSIENDNQCLQKDSRQVREQNNHDKIANKSTDNSIKKLNDSEFDSLEEINRGYESPVLIEYSNNNQIEYSSNNQNDPMESADFNYCYSDSISKNNSNSHNNQTSNNLKNDNNEIFKLLESPDVSSFMQNLEAQNLKSLKEALVEDSLHQLCRNPEKPLPSKLLSLKTSRGETVMSIAIDHDDADLIKIAYDAGANINEKIIPSRNPCSKETEVPLQRACLLGKPKCVRKLLELKANKNIVVNGFGKTLLHISPTAEITQILLDHNMNPNASDDSNTTALSTAIMNNKADIVETLCNAGADCFKPNIAGLIPFDCVNDDTSDEVKVALMTALLVKIALRHDFLHYTAQKNENNLGWFLQKVQEEKRKSVQNITPTPYQDILNAVNKNGEGLLAIAAASNYAALINDLIKLEAKEVVSQGNYGALFIATWVKAYDVMKILAPRKSFAEFQTICDGSYPMHVAAYKNDCYALKILLDAKSDVNCRNFAGATPLHYAVCFNCKEVAIFLLKNGADPDVIETLYSYAITDEMKIILKSTKKNSDSSQLPQALKRWNISDNNKSDKKPKNNNEK